jgi:RHS repeat-associated protein
VHSNTGTFQDYGFRMYDTRIARFISEDPITKEYPELSPYQFASLRPIMAVDLDGLEARNKNTGEYKPPVGGTRTGLDIQYQGRRFEAGTQAEYPRPYAKPRTTPSNSANVKWKANSAQTKAGNNSNPTNNVKSQAGGVKGKPLNSGAEVKGKSTKSINGNSKSSTKPQHGYEITNETQGVRHKVGVSGSKLNNNGTSRRANSQVNKLNKPGGDKYSADVKVKNVPNRKKILKWEQSEVDHHHRKQGYTPKGQARPKPTQSSDSDGGS